MQGARTAAAEAESLNGTVTEYKQQMAGGEFLKRGAILIGLLDGRHPVGIFRRPLDGAWHGNPDIAARLLNPSRLLRIYVDP